MLHKNALATIMMSLLVLGVSACGGEGEIVTPRRTPGPEIPITPSRSEVLWTLSDQCADGENIQFRFFQYVRGVYSPNRVWPSASGRVYVTDGFGREDFTRLPCASGQQICYGATPRSSRRLSTYWGRGIDGEQTCTGCCATCPESGTIRRSVDLVCSSLTPTPPSPTPPPLPIPTPLPPTPPPPPPPTQYSALYSGTTSGTGSSSWAWAFGTGESASAAERDARTDCERILGSRCGTRLLGGYTDYCGAVAVSECSSSTCRTPAMGGGFGRTRREAETDAIRTCERGTSSTAAGTCRVGTGRSGEPGVVCVGSAR